MLDIPKYVPGSPLIKKAINECWDRINNYETEEGRQYILSEELAVLEFKYHIINKLKLNAKAEMEELKKVNDYFQVEKVDDVVWAGLKSVYFNGVNVGINQVMMNYSGQDNGAFTILKAAGNFPIYLPLSIYQNLKNEKVLDDWIKNKYSQQLISELHENKIFKVTGVEIQKYLLEPMFRMGIYQAGLWIKEQYYTYENSMAEPYNSLLPNVNTTGEYFTLVPFLLGKVQYAEQEQQLITLYESFVGFKNTTGLIPVGSLFVTQNKDVRWRGRLVSEDMHNGSSDEPLQLGVFGEIATEEPNDEIMYKFIQQNIIRHYVKYVGASTNTRYISYLEQ